MENWQEIVLWLCVVLEILAMLTNLAGAAIGGINYRKGPGWCAVNAVYALLFALFFLTLLLW